MRDCTVTNDLSPTLYFLPESFVLGECLASLMHEIERLQAGLVIIDTDQAVAGSDDENGNSERATHAMRVRDLTDCSSRPCVIDLCHPPLSATKNSMRPRGGSAFLAEIDGNVGIWRDEASTTVEMYRTGKFRGPDFAPISFALHEVAVVALVDARGRMMTSIVAVPMSEADEVRAEQRISEDQRKVLFDVHQSPNLSLRHRAASTGLPKTTVERVLKLLCDAKAIEKTVNGYEIRPKGRRWLGGT